VFYFEMLVRVISPLHSVLDHITEAIDVQESCRALDEATHKVIQVPWFLVSWHPTEALDASVVQILTHFFKPGFIQVYCVVHNFPFSSLLVYLSPFELVESLTE
jgi:hypothetical protein